MNLEDRANVMIGTKTLNFNAIYTFVSTRKQKRQKKLEENEQRRKLDEFIRLLYHAKNELEVSRDNFNFMTDKDLIDYYIYRISAAERRLNYFLVMAKTMPVYNKDIVHEVIGNILNESEEMLAGHRFN